MANADLNNSIPAAQPWTPPPGWVKVEPQNVAPQHLMELMRHSEMRTTLKFYATDLAEQTASKIWESEKGEPK